MRTAAIVLVGLGAAALIAAVVVIAGDERSRMRVDERQLPPVPDESPCPGGRPPRRGSTA